MFKKKKFHFVQVKDMLDIIWKHKKIFPSFLKMAHLRKIFSNGLNKTILFLKRELHATDFQQTNAKLELNVVCECSMYKPI